MKKRIILTLVLALMLAFAFVVSASAAVTGSTSNEYGDVKIVDGMDDKNKYNDTTSRVVLQNEDLTYTTYPAYYIFNGSTGTGMGVDLKLLSEITGEEYKKTEIVRIEVFENARLDRTFEGCSGLVEAVLPDSVYFHYGSFSGCTLLAEVKIPSSATQIPASCFDGCESLTRVVIPDTAITLGNRSFGNCNALTEIVFPSNYKGVVPHDFRKIDNYKPSKPVTYVIPYGCTGLYSAYSINNCNVSKIVFTGDSSSAFIADLTSRSTSFPNLVEYKNHCDVFFNGAHYIKGSDNCTANGDCDRCGLEDIVKGFESHNFIETLTYPNGFVANGVYTKVCQNLATCTCQNIVDGEESVKKPIFTALADNGYSTNGDGIAFGGFVVNTDEFGLYNDLNENDITFGIFVANPKYVGDTFMKDGEVNATSGFLKVDMTSDEYTNIKIMLDGFTGKAQNLELVISLYAYTDANDVEYIQSEHTACANAKVTKTDATLYTVTLNSVDKKQNAGQIDALPEYKKDEQ